MAVYIMVITKVCGVLLNPINPIFIKILSKVFL